MTKSIRLKTSVKFAILLVSLALVLTLVVAAVFLTNPGGERRNFLTEAIEGGESTLTAVGRNHESLANFVADEEGMARQILQLARASQEQASAKLTYARGTNDEYVSKMTENYGILLDSSHIMTRGVDNLLAISGDLEQTLNYYRRGSYKEAAEEASICLQTLTPLVDEFKLGNQSLDGINLGYVASGHKDKMKHAFIQYRNEMRVYFQYISFLESIVEGHNYLEQMDTVNNLFDQLQHEIASEDYETAQRLLQEINQTLQLLKDPQYQNATAIASELDPDLLDGAAYDATLNLKNQLKDLEGIKGLENYLQSLKKYMDALNFLNQENLEAAKEAIGQGRSLLGKGTNPVYPELQRLYTGLEQAFSSLEMRIKHLPDQG